MESKTYEDIFALYFLAPILQPSHTCLSQSRAAAQGCCTVALKQQIFLFHRPLRYAAVRTLASAMSLPVTHTVSRAGRNVGDLAPKPLL